MEHDEDGGWQAVGSYTLASHILRTPPAGWPVGQAAPGGLTPLTQLTVLRMRGRGRWQPGIEVSRGEKILFAAFLTVQNGACVLSTLLYGQHTYTGN